MDPRLWGAKRFEARNYRPDRWVLLRAQITEDIDAEIGQQPSSEEVWLNIVDPSSSPASRLATPLSKPPSSTPSR